MDWITTVNGLIALISGLAGLIGTGIATFFAIKSFIKSVKQKSAAGIWSMIVAMADAAIKEAEKSGKSGKSKKEMVINSVKASCAAAGVDVAPFIDQLGAYIDSTVKWFNEMTEAAK